MVGDAPRYLAKGIAVLLRYGFSGGTNEWAHRNASSCRVDRNRFIRWGERTTHGARTKIFRLKLVADDRCGRESVHASKPISSTHGSS